MTQRELEAKDLKARYFELEDRLPRSTDPEGQKRLKAELARLTFGD